MQLDTRDIIIIILACVISVIIARVTIGVIDNDAYVRYMEDF